MPVRVNKNVSKQRIELGSDSIRTEEARSDLRRGDARFYRLRTAARYRCPCKFAWSRAKRGLATPGSRADRRRGSEGGLRKNAAAHAASRCRADPARRAAVPW